MPGSLSLIPHHKQFCLRGVTLSLGFHSTETAATQPLSPIEGLASCGCSPQIRLRSLQQGAKKSSSQHHVRTRQVGIAQEGPLPAQQVPPKPRCWRGEGEGADTSPPVANGNFLACSQLAACVPRSPVGPGTGPGDKNLRDSGTSTSSLSRAPGPGSRGCVHTPFLSTRIPSIGGTSYRFGELVQRRSPGRPRGCSLAPPDSYLGRDCRQAERDLGRTG